jgi:hypothetical protein
MPRSAKAISTPGCLDVGPTPVDVLRPAGLYRVLVRRSGYLPYQAEVTARSGEEVNLRASLGLKPPSLFKRWWFWAGVGVVVAGAATTTYFATRTNPARPEIDGGTLGWKMGVP